MTSLFAKADDGRIDDIFDPSKVPGSSVYMASNGTDLGMQAIFAGSFFLVFILLFSALRLRWPFIFSPRTRLTITSPPYLSRKFFGWFLATMRTPETYILNTLGLDTVVFLRFYKMCMRLLLDVAFFSIVIIWPINIYWSKVNLDAGREASDGDLALPPAYSVTDYLFNLTLNTSDPKQQWYLVPHIVFVYIFSALAYYHISKFSSRWASLRWHFLMQSRHALVSRTVMLTGVPRHLAKSPRELEWFWSSGLQLGKIERVRVCPFNTRLTSSAKERATCLVRLEHAYMRLLGNPCKHPDYDPQRLRALAVDPSEEARTEERRLLEAWAKPSRQPRTKQIGDEEESAARHAREKTPGCDETAELVSNAAEAHGPVKRPRAWVWTGSGLHLPWKRVDAIDYWREKFLAADRDVAQLRASILRGEDDYGRSTTAFVTFEDAATAHMATQLSCYPNPGFMKARLAPEPRGVYWPNVWIPSHRRWAGRAAKWTFLTVIWAFWSVPVILASSLLTPASLGKLFPALLSDDHNLLRAFLSTTVPSVFLLLFLNMLPWILKQVHFATGERTKPDIDYSVLTKTWAFLVFNVILVFGFSGTFWSLLIDAVNRPGTVMQNLASNIPRVGTFFTGYILVLGVGYQPFKLLQARPVLWHVCRQWLCSTPRDYARLVSPVYIDWYSVYPYPLLVFAVAMVYSTFSPPVVVGAVIYYAIGYPVMKYLLLYVYFHPFETAGMAWPRVCRRMILAIMLYQAVMLTFVVVKGGGWYTFSLVPPLVLYAWFFYFLGWALEKQGTVLPMYLWRNPPPNSSYPLPPDDAPFVGTFEADEKRSAPRSSTGPPVYQRQRSVSAAPRPPPQPRVRRGTSHHRRESSRGARTREIILAGRMRHAQTSSLRRPSSPLATTSSVDVHRVSKRKRYKSLAEAATLEGSRLLLSLGRLPAELYSRHAQTKRHSLGELDVLSARSKRRSLGSRLSMLNDTQRPDSAVSNIEDSRQNPAGTALNSEWEDVPATSRQRGKMREGSADWDPLEYLKPCSNDAYLQPAADQTLGTLLTRVGVQPAQATSCRPAPLGLRRRACTGVSVDSVDSGSQAAASIIDAEGARHSEGQRAAHGLRARAFQTFMQVRDYFLAEFRPAAPILDLTYDRMYSQGIDDHEQQIDGQAEDNGDALPPLRQLIGRVLPRSMSRVFSPAADVPPPIVGSATAPLESRPLDQLPIGELDYEHNCLDELPRPPLAPWLAAEPAASTSRRSQPLRASSSSASSLPALARVLGDKRSSHKNSLPPPRVPLTARMVSELNYVTHRSATPLWMPADPQREESEQLLIANYQKYAVERQSKFEPDEYTDYRQTPMLNFRGILDRGIQDYVHPGLIGELPTLWLPVKQAGSAEEDEPESSRRSSSVDTARMIVLAAPYRRIAALIERYRSDPLNCTDSVAAVVAAAAAANDDPILAGLRRRHVDELHEVCVHPSTPTSAE